MGHFNLGDALFQLFYLVVLVLFIVLIVKFFSYFTKQKNRLDSIEKKIDEINEQIKRNSKV